MKDQEQGLDQASLTELFLKIKQNQQAYLLFLKSKKPKKAAGFCSQYELLDHATKTAQKTNFIPPLYQLQLNKIVDKSKKKDERTQLPQDIHKHICKNNQNFRKLQSLLTLNVSTQFRNEFQEVKLMIKDQLRSGSRPRHIYLEFLKDHMLYHKISQGCFEKTMNQQELIPKLKEEGPEQIRILNDVWNRLKQNIKSHHEKESHVDPIEILLEGINNSYLMFHLSEILYGITVKGRIFININQADRHFRSLDSYRNGPLKSYIALTLYHELAHYLLQRHSQISLNETNGPLQHKQQNIGNTFLQIIKKKMKLKPKWIKIRNQQQSIINKNYYIQETVKDVSKMITKIKQQNERQCQILSQSQSQINKFIQNIQKFSIPYQTEEIREKIRAISEDQWQEIFIYINQLNPALSSDEGLWSSQHQIQYRFFISLLLFGKIFAKGFDQNDPKFLKIMECQKKIKMLSKCDNFHYYQKPISGIDNFIKKILNSTLNKNKMQQFVKYCLFEGNDFRLFIEQAQEIEKCFNMNSLRNLQVQINQLFYQAKMILDIETKKRQKMRYICFLLQIIAPNLQNLQQILQSFYAYTLYRQFQSFFEIYKIVYELPNFYEDTHENCPQKIFQQGCDIQKRLFGRNYIKYIFSKDFKLMKRISQKWREVGVEPQDEQEKEQNISIGRSGKRISQPFISVNQLGCGVYQMNQARKRLEKDLIALQKLKAERKNRQYVKEKKEAAQMPTS